MKFIGGAVLILTLIGVGLFFKMKYEHDLSYDSHHYYQSRGKLPAPAPVREQIGRGI